jgi:signal peptidase I
MLGAAVIAALLFRRHVGFVIRARGHSMWPTLRPGQFLFVRSGLHQRAIRQGDIVVLQSPELGHCIVKRVIGLPGDRVVLGSNGLVRNGVPVAESYVSRPGGRGGSWRVPAGHCFLLGDNRVASSDSSSSKQPFIPLDRIVGRVYHPVLRCRGTPRQQAHRRAFRRDFAHKLERISK